MPKVAFSTEDILRRDLIDPVGWYLCTVKKYEVKPAKKDKSRVDFFTLVVGEGTQIGLPVMAIFSEKAPGTYIPFVEAITGQKMTGGSDFDLEKAVDKELKVYIGHDEYNNKMVNKAMDFAAVDAAV